jgi:hypothetical protein
MRARPRRNFHLTVFNGVEIDRQAAVDGRRRDEVGEFAIGQRGPSPTSRMAVIALLIDSGPLAVRLARTYCPMMLDSSISTSKLSHALIRTLQMTPR